MLHALPALLLALPAQAGHPMAAEDLAVALELKKAWLTTAPGLEIWSDDQTQMKLVEKPVLAAWELAGEWLGGLHVPEELTTRLVILSGPKPMQAYLPVLQAEARRLDTSAPTLEFMEGVSAAGSGLWSYPPTVLIDSRKLRKLNLLTRAIHDLAALRARYAACPWAMDPPEFLKEGFAGMLMRHSMKRPAALVSHKGAAISSTIHGYGVFAGIGGRQNDSSNNPANWPLILKSAVKAMRKNEEIKPEERVDALLLRGPEFFARQDYAYSWAAIEFLFEDRLPYGDAAVELQAERRWKQPKEPVEDCRRVVMQAALEELRKVEYAGLPAAERGEKLRELLLQGYAESPQELHAAFMHWVENVMPKK